MISIDRLNSLKIPAKIILKDNKMSAKIDCNSAVQLYVDKIVSDASISGLCPLKLVYNRRMILIVINVNYAMLLLNQV